MRLILSAGFGSDDALRRTAYSPCRALGSKSRRTDLGLARDFRADWGSQARF